MGDASALGDGDLARAIASGEAPSAITEFCRRFAPRIRAYGLRHLGDAASADDLAQAVLELVLDKLREGAVTDPDRIASFVLGTSRNLAIEWKRSEARRRRVLDRVAPALREAAVVLPDAVALDRDRLATCLSALLPRQLTVVMLTFYADRTGDEIAGELGVSSANVRVLRHRALAALHACMTRVIA